MVTAVTFSRLNICSNVCFIVDVPAPEDPVTDMIGCCLLIWLLYPRNNPRLVKSADNSFSGSS